LESFERRGWDEPGLEYLRRVVRGGCGIFDTTSMGENKPKWGKTPGRGESGEKSMQQGLGGRLESRELDNILAEREKKTVFLQGKNHADLRRNYEVRRGRTYSSAKKPLYRGEKKGLSRLKQ